MDNLTQKPTLGTPPDLTGQTLGDFRVLRKLGQGGMGQVYLAEQVSLTRKVALKLLKAELAANPNSLERFKHEAKSVARATHANIVQVYQVGEEQGHHYMALEYVEGRNLREYITRKGPPEVLLALSIMRQVAAALQRASELGIIHRDIKPENILLTRKGEVKVADFGLSRVLEGDQPAVNLTQSGVTMGTPLYMSPEQVEGKPLDCRTDIYSLGVTCYHMLAGEPPFKGSSAFEVALQHVRSEAMPLQEVRPDLPPELCAVVHMMMAKDPAARYQSCRDLLKDLARLRESMSGQTGFVQLGTTGLVEQAATPSGSGSALATAAPSAPVMRTSPMPSRGRRWLILTLFLLSVLTAGAVGGVIGWVQQKDRSPADGEAGNIEPTPAPPDAVSPARREQGLREAIEYYLDPAGGSPNPRHGAGECLEYALPLLRQNRLDEADALFKKMESIHQVDLYFVLGTLGRGIVLALRDDWLLSNEVFKSIQVKKRKGGETLRAGLIAEALRAHPDLQKWLREAGHRNKVNSPKKDAELPPFLGGPKKDPPRDRPTPMTMK